jgi:hypothetical protein
MFKEQENESPYDTSVTVTERVFTKRTLVCEILLKHAIAKYYVTDGLTTGYGLHVTLFYFDNKLTIIQLLEMQQIVAEY